MADARRPVRATPRWVALPVALILALTAAGASLGGPAATRGAEPDPVPVAPADPTPTPTPSPTPSPTATADGPTVLGRSVTFAGRGYGHGVGMSQYGARGRALEGQDAAAILAHYYRKTTLGPLPTAPVIRVLVLDDWRASPIKPLTIYGRATDWTITGGGVFPPDAKLTLTPTTSGTGTAVTTSWRLRIVGPDGVVLADRAAPRTFTIRPASGDGRVHLRSKRGTRDVYRGNLRVIPSASAPTVDVVNRLDLEAYLRGVVPAEMPSSWPTEALRAQAIAARSYAVRKLRPWVRFFDTYDESKHSFDTPAILYREADSPTTNNHRSITAAATTTAFAPHTRRRPPRSRNSSTVPGCR